MLINNRDYLSFQEINEANRETILMRKALAHRSKTIRKLKRGKCDQILSINSYRN